MENNFFDKIKKFLREFTAGSQPEIPVTQNTAEAVPPETPPAPEEKPKDPTVTTEASVSVPPPSKKRPPAKAAKPVQERKREAPVPKKEPEPMPQKTVTADAKYTPPEFFSEIASSKRATGVPPMRMPVPPHSKIEEVQQKIREQQMTSKTSTDSAENKHTGKNIPKKNNPKQSKP